MHDMTDIPALRVSVHPGPVNFSKPFLYSKGYREGRLGAALTTACWSPILWRGGRRNEQNFHASHWCVLDFDGGYKLEACLRDFGDMIHIVATTKSHTDSHHRFRLCIPWSEPISDLRTYRHNMERIILETNSDPACKDGGRFYWPSRELIAWNGGGRRMEVEEAPAQRKRNPRPRKTGALPVWVLNVMREGRIIAPGERNSLCFRIAKDCLKAGIDIDDVANFIIQDIPILTDHEWGADKIRRVTLDAFKHWQKEIAAYEREKGADRGEVPPDSGPHGRHTDRPEDPPVPG